MTVPLYCAKWCSNQCTLSSVQKWFVRLVNKAHRLLKQESAQNTPAYYHQVPLMGVSQECAGRPWLLPNLLSSSQAFVASDFVLKLGLFVHQLLHFIRIFIDFRKSKLIVDFIVFVQHIHHLLHTFLHNVDNGFGIVQLGFLFRNPRYNPGSKNNIAFDGFCPDPMIFQIGGFTTSIEAQNANLRPIKKLR